MTTHRATIYAKWHMNKKKEKKEEHFLLSVLLAGKVFRNQINFLTFLFCFFCFVLLRFIVIQFEHIQNRGFFFYPLQLTTQFCVIIFFFLSNFSCRSLLFHGHVCSHKNKNKNTIETKENTKKTIQEKTKWSFLTTSWFLQSSWRRLRWVWMHTRYVVYRLSGLPARATMTAWRTTPIRIILPASVRVTSARARSAIT